MSLSLVLCCSPPNADEDTKSMSARQVDCTRRTETLTLNHFYLLLINNLKPTTSEEILDILQVEHMINKMQRSAIVKISSISVFNDN